MAKKSAEDARTELERELAAAETGAAESAVIEAEPIAVLPEETLPEAVETEAPKKPVVGNAVDAPRLAQFGPMKDVRHIVRYLTEMSYGGWQSGRVTGPEADEEIGELLANGWTLLYVQSLGIQPDGVGVLWVMGLPTAPPVKKYTEITHKTKVVGSFTGKAITGFMADAFVASYFAEGWTLGYITTLGSGPDGVYMMWVFLR